MAWVKKNPHLVVLLVVALLVAGGAALVAMNVQSFNDKFAPVQEKPVESSKIPPLDLTPLDNTQTELDGPTQWQATAGVPLPFVPERYKLSQADGTPEKMATGATYSHPITKERIPDKWFLDNRLPLTNPQVATLDADGDGFTNADEWLGQTDPNDPKSHPPYYTKLYLKQFIRVPFYLKFTTYDGDPQKDKPEDLSFQINSRSLRAPSQFLHIGDPLLNGKFKIIKFQFKMVNNPAIGDEEDLSELTIENNETKAQVVLVKNKEVDSPDSFALFHYVWPNPPIDFRVAKLGPFVLIPNKQERYQVLDITDNSASIKTPSGETVTIPTLPAGVP